MFSETVKNGYDLISWLCKIIMSLETDQKTLLYRRFNDLTKDRESYYRKIEHTFPFLSRTENNSIKHFDMFLGAQIKAIVEQVLLWEKNENDYIFILAMLSYLERYFDVKESLKRFSMMADYVSDNVVSFVSLNSNYVELNGILLPNFTPLWKKQGRSMSSLAEDPLSIMENYIWIPHLSDWNVMNVYSDEWKHEKDSAIKIVCSPLLNLSTFKYELREKEPYNEFEITTYEIDRIAKAQQVIEKVISYANACDADIVLLPEMQASPESLEETQRYLENNEECIFPKLTILPSSEYRDETGQWVNETRVIDYLGEKLVTYRKQQAFQLDKKGKKYFEPILGDRNLYILHMEGIGRVGIIICADVFNDELMTLLLKEYKINLLLVLAYSAGFHLFFDKLTLAQAVSCEVVWCNTCSAYEKELEEMPCVAYWSYGHQEREKYCEYYCRKRLPQVCDGCLFEIQIATGHKEKAIIKRKRFNND